MIPFVSAWGTTFLESLDAVPGPGVVGDALGEAGEADHLLEAVLGAGVDGVLGRLDDPVVVIGVVEPLREGRVGGHVDLADRAFQPGFLQEREVFRLDQLDAPAAELPGDLDRLGDVPVLLEAPVDDRLLDPAVLRRRTARLLALGFVPEARREGTESDRARRVPEDLSPAGPLGRDSVIPLMAHGGGSPGSCGRRNKEVEPAGPRPRDRDGRPPQSLTGEADDREFRPREENRPPVVFQNEPSSTKAKTLIEV